MLLLDLHRRQMDQNQTVDLLTGYRQLMLKESHKRLVDTNADGTTTDVVRINLDDTGVEQADGSYNYGYQVELLDSVITVTHRLKIIEHNV